MEHMTDNEPRNSFPPPTPQRPTTRQLYRATTGKRWLGVARGLADYLGVPVMVVRLAFVLLLFAGGLGLFAYVAAALLIPRPGEVNDLGARISQGRPDRLLAVIAAIALAAYAFFDGQSYDLIAVAALAGVGYYLWTKDRPGGPWRPSGLGQAASWPSPQRNAAAPQDPPDWQTWKPDTDVPDEYGFVPPPAYVPVAPRKRSWGWAALAASLVTMVVLTPFQNIGTVITAGFVVLLFGFVFSLIARRPSWLLLLPLVALLSLVPPARFYAHAGVPLSERSGEMVLGANDIAIDSSERRLSAGHIKVDMRGVTSTQTLRYTVGAGQIELLLPSNVGFTMRADVGLGDVKLAGQDSGGTNVVVSKTIRPDGAIRILDLDLRVGIGNITIVSTDPELGAR